MNKIEILEHLKTDPWRKNMRVDGMSLYEYALNNYKPWTFKLVSDKNEIDKTWFPGHNRSIVSGDYFGLYPSLPLWPNEFFSIDGQLIEESNIKFMQNFCGTGASLFVYSKI